MEQSSAGHGVPKIMVFRPTWDEFKDFNKFILHMEEKGAHKAGLAKIIPPPEWKPRRDDYDMDYIGKIKIPAPICQVVTGKQGLYQQINIQKKPMTVKEFRELAESERYRTPLHEDFEELERKYWKNVTFVSPIYGADVSGSLTDPDVDEWNINRLGSVLDYVNTDYGISIEGVNTAYLYFGMWKTTFAWHTEDMDLYSINFLHFGAPKSWYAIPPEHGRRLERLANGFFSSNYKSCPAYLRHKMTLISPQILKQYSIPFNRITQEAGEIMVTFPYGYHAGFNHGFNCAESTNFASPRWVEYGKRTVHCHCRKDMVKISMDTFVKRFQADRYELWITGKDIGPHPEDPNKLYAASAPSIDDILCNKNNEDVPETFFEAVEKREAKRHPIHKKKVFDKEEFEVKLKDLVQVDDEDDPLPDEETMEVMKDIWIKADESDDPDFSLDEFTSKSKRKSKGKSKKKDKPKKKIERKKSSDTFTPKPETKRLTIKLENIATTSQRIPEVKKVILPSTGSKLLNFKIPKTVIELDSLTPKRNYEDAFDTPGGETPEKATPSTSSVPKPSPESNSRYYQEVNHRNFSNWGQSMRKAMANSLSTNNKPPSASSALAKMQLLVETTPPRALDPKFETAQTLAKLKATPAVTVTLQTLAEANARQSPALVKPIVSIDPVTPQREVSGPRSQPQTPYFQPPNGIGNGKANGNSFPYFPSRTEPEQNAMTSRDLNSRQQWWPGMTGASETKAPELKPEVPERMEGEVGAGIAGETCPPPPILVRQDQDTSRREGGSYGEVERRKARKQKSPRSFKLAEVPGVSVGWASSLAFLWQRQNVNLRKEADFNFFGSQVEPFCTICALFTEARHLKCAFEATSWRESQSVLMQSHSQVWVHEENYYPRGTTVRKNDRKTGWEFQMSALLRCSQCRLCVHAKCYGQPEPSHKGAWLCQRCQEKDLQAVCCLCLWRGGALKRTTEGGWAHISCALAIPEVTFGDVVRREPIHVEHVSSERLQLPCNYCQDLGPERARGGACVQCSIGRCAQWFHPMCGWAAGVRFIDGGFTQPIRARCTCHRSERHNTSPRHRGRPPPVNVEDTVLAPHPNGGHFYARVLITKEEEFYWLDFMDGSTSKDTFPEDIVDLDCRRNGPPGINSQVKVKWTDGLVYDGIYRGSNVKCVYTMKFQDGSLTCLEREKFYSASEELPKSIRDQLPFVMPL